MELPCSPVTDDSGGAILESLENSAASEDWCDRVDIETGCASTEKLAVK